MSTGETIEVTVLEINGSQVRLGTEAPEEVHIIREELLVDGRLAGQLSELTYINTAVGRQQ